MQDRPTARELAEAVRDFLREEILPGLEDPRQSFRTRVAANGLSILARELDQDGGDLRGEAERLARLLGEPVPDGTTSTELRGRVDELRRELCARIRAGDAPDGTLDAVRESVDDKLRVTNPRALERYT